MNPFEEFVVAEGYTKEDAKLFLNVFLQKTIPELKEITPLKDMIKILKENPS